MSTVQRLPDWQLRLEALMCERVQAPFAWGTNDCATFAADCVQAMTGVRLLPELRGHDSERTALRALAEHGGLQAIATRALGEPVAPLMAAVGDIVLVPTQRLGELALAVCNGTVALCPGPDGLAPAAMSQAVAAWKVG